MKTITKAKFKELHKARKLNLLTVVKGMIPENIVRALESGNHDNQKTMPTTNHSVDGKECKLFVTWPYIVAYSQFENDYSRSTIYKLKEGNYNAY